MSKQRDPASRGTILDDEALQELLAETTIPKKIYTRARKAVKKHDPISLQRLLIALEPRLEPDHRIFLTDWNCGLQCLAATPAKHPAGFAALTAPAHQELDRRDHQLRIPSSPHGRLRAWLRNSKSQAGLVTNFKRWRFVISPPLQDTAWIEWRRKDLDKNNLTTLLALITAALKPARQHHSRLSQLAEQSRRRSLDITRALRKRARRCFQILFSSLEEWRRKGGAQNLTPQRAHEIILVVIMRIIFIVYAEEHRLLPAGEANYEQNYSLRTLWRTIDQLQPEQAWLTFLALCRLVDRGCDHLALNLPAYGGALFDSRRFQEYLDLWPIQNQDLHAALDQLLTIEGQGQIKTVSYARFDVEHIGYLYEALLDFEIKEHQQHWELRTLNRRKAAAYYTPRSLTTPIVQQSLKHLTHNPDGSPRSPRHILGLKVADITVGSGAFLVQAGRFLAQALVESWEARSRQVGHATALSLPFAEPLLDGPAECSLPIDQPQKLQLWARRLVVERCLYGTDCNPLAIEIARLSLWILSAARDKPFTFIDHALKTGDALLGIDLQQLSRWSIDNKPGHNPLFQQLIEQELAKALEQRRALTKIVAFKPEDIAWKSRRLQQAQQNLARLKLGADLLLASALDKQRQDTEYLCRFTAAQGKPQPLQELAQAQLKGHTPFHWQLEFPEVFLDHGGFDAIIANPPYLGSQKLRGVLGDRLRDFLIRKTRHAGSADLAAFFIRRAYQLLKSNGKLGLVATNSITQGQTRKVGLQHLIEQGASIHDATSSTPWPGSSKLQVNIVHINKGPWTRPRLLDNQTAPYISSRLDTNPEHEPRRLKANARLSFQGTIPVGDGFLISPRQAADWILENPKLADVLSPFLSGKDLNQNPLTLASRWIIDFQQRSLRDARQYTQAFQTVKDRVRHFRQHASNGRYQEHWWRLGEPRRALYQAVSKLERVIARARVSTRHIVAFIPTQQIYASGVVVIADQRAETLGLLQSSIHEAWTRHQASTLSKTLRYSPTRCFETFPYPTKAGPQHKGQLALAAEELHNQRRIAAIKRNIGLFPLHKLIDDSALNDPDLQVIRQLREDIDRLALAAYGWDDLLPHQHQDIIARLIQLNQQRAREEDQP